MLGSVAATVDNLESDGSVCYRGLLLGSGWQGETSSDGAQPAPRAAGSSSRPSASSCPAPRGALHDVWYRSCDSARAGSAGRAPASPPVESGASGLHRRSGRPCAAGLAPLARPGGGLPPPARRVLQGHVAERGWLPAVGGGEDVGTTGRGLAPQAVRASLEGRAGSPCRGPRGRHRLAGRRLRPSYAGTVGQVAPSRP